MSDKRLHQEKLNQRLRSLWIWELFDSFFLPAVVIITAQISQRPIGLFFFYSAGLVTWLLWQGAAYWWVKRRAVTTGSRIPAQPLRRFAVLKRVNWILIGALPMLLAIKCLIGAGFRSRFDLIAGLGLYILAVLEQVNYYHYQLMYDYPSDWQYLIEHKTLKRSSLNRALATLSDS